MNMIHRVRFSLPVFPSPTVFINEMLSAIASLHTYNFCQSFAALGFLGLSAPHASAGSHRVRFNHQQQPDQAPTERR